MSVPQFFVAPTNPSVSPTKNESIFVEVNFVDWGGGFLVLKQDGGHTPS